MESYEVAQRLNRACSAGSITTEGYRALQWLLGTGEGVSLLKAVLGLADASPPPMMPKWQMPGPDELYGPSQGGPEGDGVCCGAPVITRGPLVQHVAMMGKEAPHTTDRYCLTYKWQCVVKEEDHGYWRETSNDEKWAPTKEKT